MSATDLSMERKERKYIILEHTYDEIIQELQGHIPIFHFKDIPGFSRVETTYFDTEDFMLFREYLSNRKFRYKIRMRRYGNGEGFNPEYLVELKVKHNSLSIKRRFILPAQYYDAFLRNEDLLEIIKAANQGFTGVQKTYKLITGLIRINGFIPVLQTSYVRTAFQKKSKRIRITVDNSITHTKLLGKPKTETLDAVVLESKIMGKTPKWYKLMVNRLSLLRQQRFSKYATGINSIYFPKRGKYNFYNDDNLADKEIHPKIKDSFALLKSAFKVEDNQVKEV